MSRGLPDYAREVRPRYGGAISTSGITGVDASKITDLVLVAGKGIIYGGAMWLEHTSTQSNSLPLLVVDKSTLSNISFLRLHTYGVDRARTVPLSINTYDLTNFIYSVGISYGYTFEDALSISYDEKHGTTPTIHWRLIYALI